jgi:HSP20 family protein
MATTMTRWSPFSDFAELRARMDKLFEEVGNGHTGEWSPAIDVIREDKKIVVRADVPGIKPEDIDVKFEDGILTLSGKHMEEKEEKEKDYVRRERRYGAFSRSMTLPEGVSAEDIDATCKDGVLEVTVPIPKRERHAISIKAHA